MFLFFKLAPHQPTRGWKCVCVCSYVRSWAFADLNCFLSSILTPLEHIRTYVRCNSCTYVIVLALHSLLHFVCVCNVCGQAVICTLACVHARADGHAYSRIEDSVLGLVRIEAGPRLEDGSYVQLSAQEFKADCPPLPAIGLPAALAHYASDAEDCGCQ